MAAKTATDRTPCLRELSDTTESLLDLEQQGRAEDWIDVGVVVEGFLEIPTGFRQLADSHDTAYLARKRRKASSRFSARISPRSYAASRS